MKHWKKIAGIILALLIIFLVYRKATSIPAGITTTQVVRRTLSSGFTANGRIKPSKSVDLKFPAPAKISWISVKEGDKVRTWTALAGLDTVSLNAAYQSAQNDYRNATAAAEEVLDSVQGHDTDESFAFKARRTAAEVARDNAYNAMLAAKDALSQSTLVTPFNGTVVDIHDIVPGMTLTAADLAAKTIVVADLSNLYFDASVDEIDFSKVSEGQEAVVSIDAYPGQTCLGKVSNVSRNGEETMGGVVTFPVRVSLVICDLKLALNLNGQVEFVQNKVDNVLTIPKKYLVTKDGQSFVYLQTGSSVKNRKLTGVDTGLSSVDDIEITSGLKEGDTIIYLP